MTFEKMEFARMDDRLMATLAAMPTRVTKRSVTMKVGFLQDLSLRDALVLCPRKHGPESIEDAKGENRLEMLALADADPDLAADEWIVKPKLKASGQKSKGPEVASVLDDLKKKLADRKNGITAEKPEKAEVIPAPPLKRSIQEVVKCEEAKKPASVQKKPAPKKQKNQPSKVKTPKVPKKQEPRPIPAWWNDKQELLRSFPEDTEKRFASRCYHFVRKNEMRKGVSKDLATLTAQRAHQEAKDRWLKLFPNA
ncbi:unnamed protein product [Cladocopium goreaui]|uniref:Uncharacterized protein n=1 Tax=Cladocopium goreaui TaxID=2562237 RepID=A0A9P1CPA9_9DINO|nr:unnamed protein product [Cladocopium goreaui]